MSVLRAERDVSPRDFAARAAWMSFVGGLTQDEIARELGISRQRVQRLVARATAEGLVQVRIAHPVAHCLELEAQLKAAFALDAARVSPATGGAADPLTGLAPFAAPVIERYLTGEAPRTIAIGTGRTLRAVVDQIEFADRSYHKLVALTGNVAPDGSATAFETIMRLSEKTGARQYQLAVPVVARTADELELYLRLPHVKASLALARSADIAFVGVGQMGDDAPLYLDGFVTREDLAELQAAGAAGEIAGRVYDEEGRYLDHPHNRRLVGMLVSASERPVCCIAAGPGKIRALRAALKGGLVSQLVVDEPTATTLLSTA